MFKSKANKQQQQQQPQKKKKERTLRLEAFAQDPSEDEQLQHWIYPQMKSRAVDLLQAMFINAPECLTVNQLKRIPTASRPTVPMRTATSSFDQSDGDLSALSLESMLLAQSSVPTSPGEKTNKYNSGASNGRPGMSDRRQSNKHQPELPTIRKSHYNYNPAPIAAVTKHNKLFVFPPDHKEKRHYTRGTIRNQTGAPAIFPAPQTIYLNNGMPVSITNAAPQMIPQTRQTNRPEFRR